MPDIGHNDTEYIISIIEKRIKGEYSQAVSEIQDKLDNYLRRFKTKDETWKRWVEEGKKTEAEYKEWRTGQIAVGKRWEEMKDTLAKDYHNANVIARSIADGYMPEVYALNHDFATFQVEKDAKVDTSYTIYDRQTMERIMRDNPDLLPPPGRKLTNRIAAGLDVRWNRQQIQSVMMQALLQGESIPMIASRLAKKVGDSNYKAAIRNARTMATGAQNAGRVDSYKRAQDMGIKMKQCWVATLDSRTRHSHRQLDGETIEVGGTFSNGCRYPGDPRADGRETYNCRCALIAQLEDFERDIRNTTLRNDPDIDGMTYEEWRESRTEKHNPITLPAEKAENIKWAHIKRYREA